MQRLAALQAVERDKTTGLVTQGHSDPADLCGGDHAKQGSKTTKGLASEAEMCSNHGEINLGSVCGC